MMNLEAFIEFAKVLPEPLLLVTTLGEILAANRPAATLLGCTSRALHKKQLMDLVVDPPETVLSYLQFCSRSRQMVLGSLTFQCAEGQQLTCRTKGSVIQPAVPSTPAINLLRLEKRVDTTGDFVLLNRKIDELTQEIQQRKQIQASLLQMNEELQQAHIQIIQSEKMSALGNLVAGVAHEINNPIGFLNGSINNVNDYVQDLLEHLALYQHHYPNPAVPVQCHADDIELEFLSEDLPKLLNSMRGATDRIKGISTSLRIFSRADTEHKVNANIHEGIDSTILILKYRLKANHYRPAIEVLQNYGQLPTIECFPGQLNQVFMNVLANAIDMFDGMAQKTTFDNLKANPQNITIQTVQIETTVEIRIRDNGEGIPEDVKARIFDHLFTTKGVGKGTGLGLAITRQIVTEKHGGSINVQSELGQGTEFCICLPICTK